MEAIQDLLKGKETTAPDAHSARVYFLRQRSPIFWSSKVLRKKLFFDNVGQDIYIKDVQCVKGTKGWFCAGFEI